MDRKGFLEEMRAAFSGRAEELEEEYASFNRYQDAAWGALCAFADACEGASVPYQLAYGSLLGAVRDGGQIPWDYDIDVFVPVSQRAALMDAMRTRLDPGFYAYGKETAPRCRHNIVRVAPRGFDTSALHVDVFFLMGVPNNPSDRDALVREVKRCSKTRYHKLVRVFEETKGSPKQRLKLAALKLEAVPVNLKALDRRYEDLTNAVPYEGAALVSESSSFADDWSLPRGLFDSLERVAVGGRSFPVPTAREELLAEWYGDWRAYAPVEGRVREFEHHLKRLDQFSRKRANLPG